MSRQSGDNLYTVGNSPVNAGLAQIQHAMGQHGPQVIGFDDFLYQDGAPPEAYPWICLSGTDDEAIPPTPLDTQVVGGILRCTNGDSSGTFAADASALVSDFPVRVDYGGLYIEARVKPVTDILLRSMWFGVTDTQALEEPFSIATATVTSNASDAACFVFDVGATLQQWWSLAVDGGTDDTKNAALGAATAPVGDAWQRLGIWFSSSGDIIKYYVNDVLINTLEGTGGISPATDLYITLGQNGSATTAKSLDVDYIYWRHGRPGV